MGPASESSRLKRTCSPCRQSGTTGGARHWLLRHLARASGPRRSRLPRHLPAAPAIPTLWCAQTVLPVSRGRILAVSSQPGLAPKPSSRLGGAVWAHQPQAQGDFCQRMVATRPSAGPPLRFGTRAARAPAHQGGLVCNCPFTIRLRLRLHLFCGRCLPNRDAMCRPLCGGDARLRPRSCLGSRSATKPPGARPGRSSWPECLALTRWLIHGEPMTLRIVVVRRDHPGAEAIGTPTALSRCSVACLGSEGAGSEGYSGLGGLGAGCRSGFGPWPGQ
ncbi:MAG: hypothetical protein ACI9MC_004057 [Kiritimatiellia bacterium]|jgi:hypothetical protein